MTQKPRGLSRLIRATLYSFDGLVSAFVSETAFRQEVALFAILSPLTFVFDVSASERALMVASLMLVLIVEIINTAIEATIERISNERHPLSKKAKDCASAAVFLSLVNAVLVWLLILAG